MSWNHCSSIIISKKGAQQNVLYRRTKVNKIAFIRRHRRFPKPTIFFSKYYVNCKLISINPPIILIDNPIQNVVFVVFTHIK